MIFSYNTVLLSYELNECFFLSNHIYKNQKYLQMYMYKCIIVVHDLYLHIIFSTN